MSQQKQDQLSRVIIEGYKSIEECDVDLKNINVLIGSNGAGKSNFVSAFTLLQSILREELSHYVGKKGGAHTLLYKGVVGADSIKMSFAINDYTFTFKLDVSDDNRLIIYHESFVNRKGQTGYITAKPVGLDESEMMDSSRLFTDDTNVFFSKLKSSAWRVYHFHDTGPTSKMKQSHNISNAHMFFEDARNLAAFLYRLRTVYPPHYKNILDAVKIVAPYFEDFVLEPEELNHEYIFLRWQQKGCEDIFNPSQLSDGTLRFICLATLLLQPPELQPATIIIDEPELGLHPFAITIFAEMVKSAAVNKQIILSTQSVELLNHFEADDVIVVDRSENGSKFKRLDSEKLKIWLDDYKLGELWNMNILGGRLSMCID